MRESQPALHGHYEGNAARPQPEGAEHNPRRTQPFLIEVLDVETDVHLYQHSQQRRQIVPN